MTLKDLAVLLLGIAMIGTTIMWSIAETEREAQARAQMDTTLRHCEEDVNRYLKVLSQQEQVIGVLTDKLMEPR